MTMVWPGSELEPAGLTNPGTPTADGQYVSRGLELITVCRSEAPSLRRRMPRRGGGVKWPKATRGRPCRPLCRGPGRAAPGHAALPRHAARAGPRSAPSGSPALDTLDTTRPKRRRNAVRAR
jgi:hypothetical protein